MLYCRPNAVSHDRNAAPPAAGNQAPPALQALVEEPPYHPFILSSLGLGVAAGFLLATLVPLSVALDWGWGGRYRPLAQAHGQVQLLGWVGLFIMAMACRMMPRFSGRPLRFRALVWVSWAGLATSLMLRVAAQPAEGGQWRDGALLASGALGVIAALAFGLVVGGTLVHPRSRAEATGHFFVLGAAAFLAQAAMNLTLVVAMVRDGDSAISVADASGLLHLQVYGFIVMFVLGVASRAVPTFSGLPRPERSAKVLAWSLAVVVVAFVLGAELIAGGERNAGVFRLQAAALAGQGPLLLAGVWLAGVFRPAANRLRPASQPHVWFIRSAFAWLAVAGGLSLYYGLRAAVDGAPLSYNALDAVRHTVVTGFASIMIIGMAMLVVPEFAIRRMRHGTERLAPLLLLALMNTATALRVSASVAAPQLAGTDRYWPMAVAGVLAEVALLLFLALFVQSWREKRSIVESQVPLRAAR